jgi:hypothetical protein
MEDPCVAMYCREFLIHLDAIFTAIRRATCTGDLSEDPAETIGACMGPLGNISLLCSQFMKRLHEMHPQCLLVPLPDLGQNLVAS